MKTVMCVTPKMRESPLYMPFNPAVAPKYLRLGEAERKAAREGYKLWEAAPDPDKFEQARVFAGWVDGIRDGVYFDMEEVNALLQAKSEGLAKEIKLVC